MKLCRYDDNRIGVVRDGAVHDVTGVLDALPARRYPFPLGDVMIATLNGLRPAMEQLARSIATARATLDHFADNDNQPDAAGAAAPERGVRGGVYESITLAGPW